MSVQIVVAAPDRLGKSLKAHIHLLANNLREIDANRQASLVARSGAENEKGSACEHAAEDTLFA
jgi:hypothetical protein